MLGLGAGWHEPEHRAFGYEMLLARRPDQPVRRGQPARPRDARRRAGRRRRAAGSAATRCATTRRRSRPGCRSSSGAAARSGRSGSSPATRTSGTARAIPRRTPTRARSSTRHCAEVGRDPAAIRRTVGVQPVCIRDTREAAVDALGGDPRGARAATRRGPRRGPRARRWPTPRTAVAALVPGVARGRRRGGDHRPADADRRRDVRAPGRSGPGATRVTSTTPRPDARHPDGQGSRRSLMRAAVYEGEGRLVVRDVAGPDAGPPTRSSSRSRRAASAARTSRSSTSRRATRRPRR